jgi:cytochrome c-type biogenesis protein
MLFTNWINVFDGSTVNIWIAFAAGFLTFFASCLLPLVPSYLVYISGLSYSEIVEAKGRRRRDIIINACIFTLGFIIAFVILGAAGNKLYSQLTSYRRHFEIFAGLIFIILGLYNLNFLKFLSLSGLEQFIGTEFRLNTKNLLGKSKLVNSLLIGLGFGLAWTPCIGPVLGLILYWASKAETLIKGLYLLIMFGVGMGLPFIITAAGAELLVEKLNKIKHFQKIVGVIAVLAGLRIIFR